MLIQKEKAVNCLPRVSSRGEPLTVYKRRRRFGFTLIELLVVVAILATLAGAIIYATDNAREKAKDSRRKEDLKAVSSALVSYYADHGEYPQTIDGELRILDYSSDTTTDWLPALGDYLQKQPKDPLKAGLSSFLTSLFKRDTNQPNSNVSKGQVAGSVTTTLGETNVGSQLITALNSSFHGSRFTTGEYGGSATTISVHVASVDSGNAGKFKLAIYNDVSGTPGSAIATTAEGNLVANSWNTLTITTPPTLTANTTYWLFYKSNTSNILLNNSHGFTPSTNDGYLITDGYGGPWPNGTPGFFTNDRMSIYVNYNFNQSTTTGTVAASNDDAVKNKTNNGVNKTANNNTNGRGNCGDDQLEPYFRFTLNQGLIHNVHIDSAKINFNPKVSGVEGTINGGPSPKTRFRAEAALDPGQIVDGTDWNNRQKTQAYATWENIGAWSSPATVTYSDPALASVVQELVDKYASQGISIHIINIFWENTDPSNCGGRAPESKDGGTPPTLEIETSANPSTPGCSPLTQTINPGTANFYANSGNGVYSWTQTTGTGTILNNSQNSDNLQISYASTGTYGVKVTSNGVQSGECQVTVSAQATPPTCSPSSHPTVNVGQTASFTASGGNGTYSWNAPGGSIIGSSGSSSTLQVSYNTSSPPPKSVTVTSNSVTSSACTVTVNPQTPPSDTSNPGGDPGSTGGACDSKTEIYCYRVSWDKKQFILWAQLENENDPDIYNSPADTAVCNDSDITVIPPTPVQPSNSLNYCIRSPR